MLLSGKKTVETRSYPIPAKYIGQELAIIETPGPRGAAEASITTAQIIGVIRFSGSFRYATKTDWLADQPRHSVSPSDPLYAFKTDRPKFGWVVESAVPLSTPKPAPKKRGIIFASKCLI